MLVCVDDAQWIDSASLEALGFAARRLGGDRVAILAAFRDEVAASFRVPRFELLALGGLGEDAIATLVAGCGRAAAQQQPRRARGARDARQPAGRAGGRRRASATTGWRAGSGSASRCRPGG